MFNAFSKNRLTLLSALLLTTVAGSLIADDNSQNKDSQEPKPTNSDRFYIGAFGGELFSYKSHASQMGTALFDEASGGPLAVEARGRTKKADPGFGGVQLGYEWSKYVADDGASWALAPTAEMEAFWFSRKVKGTLFNQTDTDRLPEHDFVDSFRLNEGVYLANFVLSVNNRMRLVPYVGAGVGATHLSLRHAKSKQVAPPEPGVNHFNSMTKDSTWAFAAQVKAGLRYGIWRFNFFGEYRYLYVDSSKYVFGSTVYPFHAHTTPWNVKLSNSQYNGFVFGIQFDL